MSDSKVNRKAKNQNVIKTSSIIQNTTNPTKILPSTELIIEFLTAVMTKDYEMALKYCTEILKQEPNNLTAQEFYPLIVEKLEMIKNEELESTSESSTSSSAGSSPSSSEYVLNDSDISRSFPNEFSQIFLSHKDGLTPQKINGSIASYPLGHEKTVTSRCKSAQEYRHTKPMDSSLCLHSTPKLNFGSLLKEERDSPVKPTRNDEKSPNILIHPTQTKTIISKNALKTKTRTVVQARAEKESQNNFTTYEHPSKISLRTSRTITFPKQFPPQNFTRTENPQ